MEDRIEPENTGKILLELAKDVDTLRDAGDKAFGSVAAVESVDMAENHPAAI